MVKLKEKQDSNRLLDRLSDDKKQEYIAFLRSDPVFAAKELLGVDMAPHERVMLRGMWTHKWVLGIWGRGAGKCALDSALLYDSITNEYIPHEEAYQRYKDTQFNTLGMVDKYKIGEVGAIIQRNGIKSCVKVSLRSGRAIKVTNNHPLLKIDGWAPADNLVKGDRVATARKLPEGKEEVTPEKAKLLGYFIGDGGTTVGIGFTNQEFDILEDFKQSLYKEYGEIKLYQQPSGKATSYYNSTKQAKTIISELGLLGKKSIDKSIPLYVYSWNNDALSYLLGAYFDCDGSVSLKGHNILEYYSSSRELLEGAQRLLLRFGVISCIRSKPAICNGKKFKAYRLTVSGSTSVKNFCKNIKVIGKKNKELEALYNNVCSINSNTNVDTIPKEVYSIYSKILGKTVSRGPRSGKRYKFMYSPSRATLGRFGEDFDLEDAVDLSNSDIFWDEVVSIEDIGMHETYAVEVPEFNNYLVDTVVTHNTWENAVFGILRCLLYSGEKVVIIAPTFRQSIFVFNEMERILRNAVFFQQALIDKPKHHANEYSMIFRNGSTVTALPLGVDGSKIRGTRATVIIVDEAAQVPSDIIDQAIIPFMATRKNPMAKYLGIEEENSTNVLVFSSSAYYQFNHLFEKYMYWLTKIKEGDDKYFVTKFNYLDTPDGFIDLDVVEMQRKMSPDIIFRMEYLAEFPRDSMGFYPASLIHKCTDRFVAPLVQGDSKKEYVMGMDPARSDDNFGITILELNGDIRNIVYCSAHSDTRTPDMKMHIYDLLERFNVVRLGSDKFGGGRVMADLMEEGHKYISSRTGKLVQIPPIFVIDDKKTEYLHGKRIMELVVFSSQSVSEMNFSLKARMENGGIRFPASPYESNDVVEEAEKIFEDIVELKTEMTNIEVERTAADYLKFVVPEGYKKDRYSSLLVANYAADHYVMEGSRKPALAVGFWGGAK